MFILHLKLDLGVFFYQMCNQNCLQQTEQHKGKNHNAVCCWKDETSNSLFFFLLVSGSSTYMKYVTTLKHHPLRNDSLPMSGVLLDMEGRMSFRMSSRTEIASRTVTLKPSFSPRWSAMKKEARSRVRKNKMGNRKLMTWRSGLLFMLNWENGFNG